MAKMTVKDIPVRDKKVLVRVDFNVPLKEGQLADDTRIRASLPTVDYLLNSGASIILASHLGRPKGKVDPRYTLAPVARRLGELLGREIIFAPDCVGEQVGEMARGLDRGEILLLENLRFHAGEEKNDPAFARGLAQLADVFVNDAFGAAHRAHASTAGVAEFLPCVAGLLMEKELKALGSLLTGPRRPFVAILGGAKVSDKIGVMENLLKIVDTLIIGGGMANTMLFARGLNVGKSLCETDKKDLALSIIQKAAEKNIPLLLPVDAVVAPSLSGEVQARAVPVENVAESDMILDIGPKTAELFVQALQAAGTVFWNGPLGAFEVAQFSAGTLNLAKAVAEIQANVVVGGGDTIAAVNQAGVADKISHISTGGGASLEFLEGKTLPGVAVLRDKVN